MSRERLCGVSEFCRLDIVHQLSSGVTIHYYLAVGWVALSFILCCYYQVSQLQQFCISYTRAIEFQSRNFVVLGRLCVAYILLKCASSLIIGEVYDAAVEVYLSGATGGTKR